MKTIYTMPDRTESWEILYSDFSGAERRAVEMLSRNFGRYVLRDQGVYALHVLPCRKEAGPVGKNAIVVGTVGESALARRFVRPEEIPAGGYCVRVVPNPDSGAYRIVIVTAAEKNLLCHGAAAFLREYIVDNAPAHDGLRFPELLCYTSLPEATYAAAPKIATRGIFTWGHPINDYRTYIEDMAKQKLNQLIVWNDHVPVNAADIAACAHSYGIELIWGYAWGWKPNVGATVPDISAKTVAAIKERAIREFEESYLPLGIDGIYFQSFTEVDREYTGGVLIAKAVTDLVNEVSGVLLDRYPHLKIQFGLHAQSVNKHLDEIARVDKRVEILWEDCGEFPFRYIPRTEEDAFKETETFTEKILALRGDAPVGLMFKGFVTLDWTLDVPPQSGSYILGENHPAIAAHDKALRKNAWKYFTGEWTQYGRYAQRIAQLALERTGGKVNLCMAGAFDGGIWVPEAICSGLFWDPDIDFKDLVCRVMADDEVQP